MSRRNKLLVLVVLLGAPAGLLYYNSTACACLTPDRAAQVFLRTDFGRVIRAQQAFRALSGRYAGSFEELQFQPDTALRLSLASITDSAFRLTGVAIRWPGVACTLDVLPTTTSASGIQCSGHAPGPLGF